jgi:DNA phosphorothioation-associated putative methyltransferase
MGDLKIGKTVGGYTYLHASAFAHLSPRWHARIAQAASCAGVHAEIDFNVVKIATLTEELSLLHYGNFFEAPFPALARSWRVNLDTNVVTYRNYTDSRNPPILHRKELLLAPDHPRIEEYAALTQAGEAIGLFDDTRRIGFREYWGQLIEERGYALEGNQFVPIANEGGQSEIEVTDPSGSIRRHLTALSRTNYSAPVQMLLRHNLLNESTRFFDYGCGRGNDIFALRKSGIEANGWDPFYANEAQRSEADVVNLGFVINVIEDVGERIEALQQAYALTRGVLSVAAMLTSQIPADAKPYRDGYVSSRQTFQKYFSQSQLRDFIELTLDTTAIAAGTGVFLVFRDKELEQRFLSAKYGRALSPRSRPWESVRKEPQPRARIDRRTQLVLNNLPLLEALWERNLELGRAAQAGEVDERLLAAIEVTFGSIAKAQRIAVDHFPPKSLERAYAEREADLRVWGALEQFQKRRPYKHLDPHLKTDVKHFFGDYQRYQLSAQKLLYEIGNVVLIDEGCKISAQNGYGWLDSGHSLQLHSSLLERLPAVLRVYVGCATVLCGDIGQFDLIKIHLRSGKVTLMKFDDFEGSALPRMTQRIKVKLRDQDLDIFNYGDDFPSPLLYHKSRYINEEFPGYEQQSEFEQSLEALGLLDLSGFGPSKVSFHAALEAGRWALNDNRLQRSQCIPDLDRPCGRYLTFRQLISCGETQAKTGLVNLPKEPDSYTALYELASKVLDPIIDYFGMITPTYGFCSHELSKAIEGRIAPKLDQHAAHEKTRAGKPICERLGAACDFIVQDEDMEEVAVWAYTHTPVDRIYFYGKGQPIHISYSQTPAAQFVDMKKTGTGKQIPRVRHTLRHSQGDSPRLEQLDR